MTYEFFKTYDPEGAAIIEKSWKLLVEHAT